MDKYYLGVDIGSISTKAVIIDEKYNIVDSDYIWTNADPINAVKKLISNLSKNQKSNINIVGSGTTGSARKLIGAIVNASVVKNEITAHAIGTLSRHNDVNTILEIGGQDSKIIIIKDGIVVDYAMNTLCAAGTGSFLASQAKRLNVEIEDIGDLALKSKSPAKIAARCTVFAESDLVHKAQIGYSKEDILAGLCKAVVLNYLNNVGKGKKIEGKIVFQGGVSKNIGVKNFFEKELNSEVFVDENAHLMGALGVAIMAAKSKIESPFNFDIKDKEFKTKNFECSGCSNNCEVITVLDEDKIIDRWGNRCDKFNI